MGGKFEKGQSGNPSTQFKPGQSGNPKGRPKKLPQLDELLADVLGDDTKNNEQKTIAEGIIMRLADMALKGDTKAASILLDRAYGKAVQPIEGNMNITNIRVGFDDE